MYKPKKNDDKENYSLIIWSVVSIVAVIVAMIELFNGNVLASTCLWVASAFANDNVNHAELMEEMKKLNDKINS